MVAIGSIPAPEKEKMLIFPAGSSSEIMGVESRSSFSLTVYVSSMFQEEVRKKEDRIDGIEEYRRGRIQPFL